MTVIELNNSSVGDVLVTCPEIFFLHSSQDSPVPHEGSTGTIAVIYTTSIHNGGTGWVAKFVGKQPGTFHRPSL
jgi:hypothetical protein